MNLDIGCSCCGHPLDVSVRILIDGTLRLDVDMCKKCTDSIYSYDYHDGMIAGMKKRDKAEVICDAG